MLLKPTAIPPDGTKLALLDATDTANWAAVVDRLSHDLIHTSVQAATAVACPYPGMRAYDELNSHHFMAAALRSSCYAAISVSIPLLL
ncbi:MAG: hypothetical protein R2867_08525 [Caldilineaceae bacterium]